ncbi:MAG: glycosyltransferase family 39 protein [Patescibacteria group bacterium]
MSRQNLFLILLGFIYYFFFINKGIVLYDEGYYFHIADRILQGEIPYKDFFLQFSPGYFYLLAFSLKIFGEQIVVGRLLTLFICLCILFLTLKISEKLGFSRLHQKFLVFAAVVSFGFPLINNPSTLAWIIVFASLLLVYSYIIWFKNQNTKHLLLLGLFLGLCLAIKQNLGLYFFVATNIFVFLSSKGKFSSKTRSLLIVNLPVLFISSLWISYFFLIQSDINRFFELVTFNSRYLSIYPFSYPSLTFLLAPDGIFKLLPYYLPIVFSFILIKEFLNKKKNMNIL